MDSPFMKRERIERVERDLRQTEQWAYFSLVAVIGQHDV